MAQLLILSSPQAMLSLLLFPLTLLLLLGYYYYSARSPSKQQQLSHGRRLPPSPPRLPVIGHLHLVGSDPHVSLAGVARKHAGPDGLMLLRLGQVLNLIVSSPRAAEAVLRTHDHFFASRPPSTVADILLGGASDVALAPYGEYWRQARKLVTTHLLSARKVHSLHRDREEEVRLVIAKIREAAAADAERAGGVVDMTVLLGAFTNDIACRAVSGKFYREEDRNRLFREVIDENAATSGGFNFLDYFPSLAKDMFVAGTDTSYIVLEFAMAELMRKPYLMSKLQAEVRAKTPKDQEMVKEDDVSSMTYLKAVVKETLRLHPPLPLLLPHLSMVECDVNGYTIPAETRVIINAWALGRDTGSWEEANEFLPDRFMDTATVDFKGRDFQYLPFGAGRRICPGIHFGMASVEIMLANLVYCFNWELPDGMRQEDLDMRDVFGMTMHRKEKLILVPTSQDVRRT